MASSASRRSSLAARSSADSERLDAGPSSVELALLSSGLNPSAWKGAGPARASRVGADRWWGAPVRRTDALWAVDRDLGASAAGAARPVNSAAKRAS